MEHILSIRETLVGVYKQHEAIFLILAKFLAALIVFGQVSGIGFYMPMLGFLSTIRLPFVLLMAALFTILPMSVGYGLIIVSIALQTSSALGITAFITAFLFLMLLLYAHLAPRESFLILATYLGYSLGIPFIVPLLAGLYLSITSIIPIALGVMIWSFIPFFAALLNETLTTETNIADIAGYLGNLYEVLFAELWANEGWVFTAFILVMVNLSVFAISRLSLNNAKEIAIATGVIVAVVSSIIASIISAPMAGLVFTVVSAIISGMLAYLVSFFDMVLDYQRAERVQFEDEHNFYQVRIIPKISVSRKENIRKRISPYDEEEEEEDEGEGVTMGYSPQDIEPPSPAKRMPLKSLTSDVRPEAKTPMRKKNVVSQDTDTAIVLGRTNLTTSDSTSSRLRRVDPPLDSPTPRKSYGSRYESVSRPDSNGEK